MSIFDDDHDDQEDRDTEPCPPPEVPEELYIPPPPKVPLFVEELGKDGILISFVIPFEV